ncbi:MAG: hypothetical protein D6799_03815 [Bacteroidetes bacterium]|nr:MAG: hypothetical protein D6799_03815 [Bacteroidota bacterium]
MKYFKPHIVLLTFLLGYQFTLAQSPRIDEARVNFIAQKLQLSPSESKAFWPLYNEYIDKMKAIRKERKKLFNGYNYSSGPADAEQFVSKHIQLDNAEIQIRNEYIQKFKQLIGPVKTAYLLKAEEEFRLELIKILKSEKQD